jgi:hypothetical protein
MNYSDITKLTGYGNYAVDYPILHLPQAIERFVKEDNLLLNPPFQRGYVWTELQQIAFVEFLLRGGRTTPILFNHPGWMTSFQGEFVCVDGLQRLTAILKFINNNLAVFNGHTVNEIKGITPYLRGIMVNIRINDLQTTAEVLHWYLELNSGGTIHTKEELAKVEMMLKTLCS